MLLNQLYGASIEFRESGLDMNAEGEAVSRKLSEGGLKPISSLVEDQIQWERWVMLIARWS